jgi:hypothetical protein
MSRPGVGGSPRFLTEPYAKPGSGVKNWDGEGFARRASFFTGDIHNVAVYDHAMTDKQVKALHAAASESGFE